MENKKGIFLLIGVIFITVIYIVLNSLSFIPDKIYYDGDFGYKRLKSNLDADGDSVDDYQDILEGAREYVKRNPPYKSSYYKDGYPTEENLKKLNGDRLYQKTYDFMKQQENYNYPTKTFSGNMSASELKNIFIDIATEVTEATKVTSLCITIDDLKKEGYLSKDSKINDELAKNTYIIISENAATNQYVFSIAKTEEQKQQCQSLLAE